ncbi:hypothetical protein Tco_0174350, partial [Tanacetum coccineum]
NLTEMWEAVVEVMAEIIGREAMTFRLLGGGASEEEGPSRRRGLRGGGASKEEGPLRGPLKLGEGAFKFKRRGLRRGLRIQEKGPLNLGEGSSELNTG